MPENTFTNDELMRALIAVQNSITRVEDRMLTTDMFNIHQAGTDRRFVALEQDLSTAKIGSRAEHVRFEEMFATAKKETDSQFDKLEEVSRNQMAAKTAQRQAVWLAVFITVLGGTLSLAGSVLVQVLSRP